MLPSKDNSSLFANFCLSQLWCSSPAGSTEWNTANIVIVRVRVGIRVRVSVRVRVRVRIRVRVRLGSGWIVVRVTIMQASLDS